jgi:hypothetical protein
LLADVNVTSLAGAIIQKGNKKTLVQEHTTLMTSSKSSLYAVHDAHTGLAEARKPEHHDNLPSHHAVERNTFHFSKIYFQMFVSMCCWLLAGLSSFTYTF